MRKVALLSSPSTPSPPEGLRIGGSLPSRTPTLAFPENRLRFLHKLQSEGFHARRHGYDFFVRRSLFVCAISLLPQDGLIILRRIPWNQEESDAALRMILEIVGAMDPNIRIRILG